MNSVSPMNNKFLSFFCGGFCLMISACQSNTRPPMIPAVEVKRCSTPALEIIGGVEPVYFLPLSVPFEARIDTGAETSSVGVSKQRSFERDGEKWVSFEINGVRFEKKVQRKVTIRRIDGNEQRVSVFMDVKIGNELINAEFTLADRSKFEYQGLIGRNILKGRFIVDPSLEHTLR